MKGVSDNSSFQQLFIKVQEKNNDRGGAECFLTVRENLARSYKLQNCCWGCDLCSIDFKRHIQSVTVLILHLQSLKSPKSLENIKSHGQALKAFSVSFFLGTYSSNISKTFLCLKVQKKFLLLSLTNSSTFIKKARNYFFGSGNKSIIFMRQPAAFCIKAKNTFRSMQD